MKSIFNPTDNQELIDRLNNISADAKPLWGKMNAAQMMAHLQEAFGVALGEVKSKRGLLGYLFGAIAKKNIMKAGPIKKNLPTVPGFVVSDERNLEIERSKLTGLIQRFIQGPSALADQPHPFFGKLKSDEQEVLHWKHLNHHLTQFGV